MLLSDLSVKRPVLAIVMNLLIIVFGITAFIKLPLREYPDIDPPIVTVDTTYRGAAANVVETKITELIEDRIAGIEAIKTINSKSTDGRSQVTIEFDINRDIDAAVSDIRDRVSAILGDLPAEADPPEIRKTDSDDNPIIWLNLNGEGMNVMELTDYAHRYLVDRFSVIDGVARVRIGGAQEKAMRIWIDYNALAARNLTVSDLESALRAENVELPAGSIESPTKDFTVRIKRHYKTVKDFENLVIKRADNGYLVKIKDVAKVEVAPVERRSTLRGNGIAMVGLGIIKQSKANTIDVARAVKEEMEKANKSLPSHMALQQSYDTSVFIESSIKEVYKTLVIAIVLVVFVIYCFLGSVRAMLIPAATVPISLIGCFIVLYAFGYTVNILTLLALVLAIGLVVDDAIIVIENIHRRIEMSEPRLLASFRGTRQVGFAVVATTVVLVAVFIPLSFLEGDVGRLFSEFSIAICASVIFSMFAALTIAPMLSSKIMAEKGEKSNKLTVFIDQKFNNLRKAYLSVLESVIKKPSRIVVLLVATLVAIFVLMKSIPNEFTPKEDRGVIFMFIKGPEGASYKYTLEHVNEVEKRLMPFVKSGEFHRLLFLVPGSFGFSTDFNNSIGIVVLNDWDKRKPIGYYVGTAYGLTSDIPGVFVFPVPIQPLGGRPEKPVQFVIGGSDYQQLAKWRDIILSKARQNPNLTGLDYDYKETKPQISVQVKLDRSADLGVSIAEINNTLETILGSKRVTTYIEEGEEYDIILESDKDLKTGINDINNIYVASQKSGMLIPLSNLVDIKEFADSASLNRYNRLRSITIEANLAPGYSLGEALQYFEDLVKENLPSEAHIDYKGESLDYKETGSSIYFIFLLALIVVFLVLAGQFESFIHPAVIMLTVPLAVVGALFGMFLTVQSLNIYSQIGLIILIGLAAKNGILIVEFINQLRDEGVKFEDAILEASGKRLRPIIMTAFTTAMGSVPLIFSSGAGSETRLVIGVVIFFGVIVSVLFTIFVIPAIYKIIARNTASPHTVSDKLEKLLTKHKDNKI